MSSGCPKYKFLSYNLIYMHGQTGRDLGHCGKSLENKSIWAVCGFSLLNRVGFSSLCDTMGKQPRLSQPHRFVSTCSLQTGLAMASLSPSIPRNCQTGCLKNQLELLIISLLKHSPCPPLSSLPNEGHLKVFAPTSQELLLNTPPDSPCFYRMARFGIPLTGLTISFPLLVSSLPVFYFHSSFMGFVSSIICRIF